jgi:hypothetical protein
MLAMTLLLAATAACADREADGDTAAADTLSRDLQLAPADTAGVALNDAPADTATPEPPPAAAPAPTPAPARPRPATPRPQTERPRAEQPASGGGEAAPATRALAAGASFAITTSEEFGSHKNKVGDVVTAEVASDVKDSRGRVVIPAGSTVSLAITALKESENKSDNTGTLTLDVRSVSIGGRDYPLTASITGLQTELRGRKTGAGDVAKVGVGAGAGAVVGRVLGGSTKGAVIGGIIGGAVGAQRAVETKDRDVVVPAGSRITITVDERFERTA